MKSRADLLSNDLLSRGPYSLSKCPVLCPKRHIYLNIYVCTHTCMHICMFVDVHVCMYIYVYIHDNNKKTTHVCTCIRMYVYMYTYTMIIRISHIMIIRITHICVYRRLWWIDRKMEACVSQMPPSLDYTATQCNISRTRKRKWLTNNLSAGSLSVHTYIYAHIYI